MTEEQRAELRFWEAEMAKVAIKVGPMHAWWDDIFDIREVLAGGEGRLKMSPEEWIIECKATFAKWPKHPMPVFRLDRPRSLSDPTPTPP